MEDALKTAVQHSNPCPKCGRTEIHELCSEVASSPTLPLPRQNLIDVLTDVGQLLNGWHADGTVWSDWDESVRVRVSGALQGLLAASRSSSPCEICHQDDIPSNHYSIVCHKPDCIAWFVRNQLAEEEIAEVIQQEMHAPQACPESSRDSSRRFARAIMESIAAASPIVPLRENHCIGTFWTDAEIAVIDELAKQQELSHMKVISQALKAYQLIVKGHSRLVEVNPEMKLAAVEPPERVEGEKPDSGLNRKVPD